VTQRSELGRQTEGRYAGGKGNADAMRYDASSMCRDSTGNKGTGKLWKIDRTRAPGLSYVKESREKSLSGRRNVKEETNNAGYYAE
jgi:hypothetical protein